MATLQEILLQLNQSTLDEDARLQQEQAKETARLEAEQGGAFGQGFFGQLGIQASGVISDIADLPQRAFLGEDFEEIRAKNPAAEQFEVLRPQGFAEKAGAFTGQALAGAAVELPLALATGGLGPVASGALSGGIGGALFGAADQEDPAESALIAAGVGVILPFGLKAAGATFRKLISRGGDELVNNATKISKGIEAGDVATLNAIEEATSLSGRRELPFPNKDVSDGAVQAKALLDEKKLNIIPEVPDSPGFAGRRLKEAQAQASGSELRKITEQIESQVTPEMEVLAGKVPAASSKGIIKFLQRMNSQMTLADQRLIMDNLNEMSPEGLEAFMANVRRQLPAGKQTAELGEEIVCL